MNKLVKQYYLLLRFYMDNLILKLFCRLKIFVPITALAFAVLVPVNWTNNTLEKFKDLTFSDIDKLSISNVPDGSSR